MTTHTTDAPTPFPPVPPGDPIDATGFLDALPMPARDQLAGSLVLREFVQTAGDLTFDDRLTIIDQALVLLGENYVHLPFKVAMHAVNPLQRLRLLRARVERQGPEQMDPEWRFHRDLSEIFHSVRDLHTNYLLPAPFAGKVAFLPFLVEDYVDGGRRRYVVSATVPGFSAPGFGPGAEVRYWNGVPVDRAVEVNADRFAGSNAAARHARGLESLTIRPLRLHLPPDEEWVTVGYLGLDEVEHELRQPWLVTENLPPMADFDELRTETVSLGLDLHADETSRARKLLFAPQVVAAEAAADPLAEPAGADVASTMPGVFRARAVTTPDGTFAHIRIFTFSVEDPDAFVAEFVRLLGLVPQDGLILDVRGNGGGHIYASEFLLQTLTPRRITPEPVQFIATALNTRICGQHRTNPTGQIDLGPWHPSLAQAVETGAAFSAAFPITPEDGANAVGQQYFGPVVLVTDARCYSATDIFAAGFQDHGVGTVLGVDANTGAGGANVWTHGLLMALLEIPAPDPRSPYRELPGGANMRVSIRRTLRVGAASGTPVEDLGVEPDDRHDMTRDDILSGNADLLARAGALLATQPVRRLVVDADVDATGTLTLALDVAGVDRADVYLDDRPAASVDVTGSGAMITLPDATGVATVRVEGFEGGELVAARRVHL